MTKDERAVLVEGFTRISTMFSLMAASFASDSTTPVAIEKNPPEPVPEKTYTYKEVRAILAEKARSGYRAEVKAILTAHGIQQLSDVKDQEMFAAIVKEAKEIGNG